MANSARIHPDGVRLYMLLDPSSGTLTQPATIDTDELANIALTFSGGAVTVVAVECEDKYPFVNLTDNQFKVCFQLSRRVKFGETGTVDIPANLVSDGTRTNATSTGLSVTNESYIHDAIGDLITNSHRIVYVDPTGGDDTAAAAAKGVGYYLKTDTEVGTDPDSPDGSPIAYATLQAATAATPTGTPAMVLLKRGETFNGLTNYVTTNTVVGARSGTSSNPFVFAAYGSGAQPVVLPSTTSGTARTAFSTNDVDYCVVTGLDLRHGNNCVVFSLVGSEVHGNVLLEKCKINRMLCNVASTTGTRYERVAVDRCVITNGNTGSGLTGNSNFDFFPHREYSFTRSIFHKLGQNALEHALYTKSIGDMLVAECIFDDNSGSGMKLDTNWGCSVRNNICLRVQGICSIQTNGSTEAGVQIDRTRDTETGEYPDITNAHGAYNKWFTVKHNIICDFADGFGRNQAVLAGYGQAYDSTVRDNFMYTEWDKITQGCDYGNSPGSGNGYTRDGWNCKYRNNTMVFNAGTVTQFRAISIQPAANDDYSDISTTPSKAHHELLVDRNIIWIGTGISGGTTKAIDIDSDWSDAEDLDRIDGQILRNCIYRSSGQTNLYQDGATAYSTIAAIEASLNETTGSTASGNRFEDPGFNSIGYQVSDWALAEGYADLDDFTSTVADEVLAGTTDLSVLNDTIAASVLIQYQASALLSVDYDDILPGLTPWVTLAPSLIPPSAESSAASSLLSSSATLTAFTNPHDTITYTVTERGFVHSETATNANPQIAGTGVTKTAVAGLSGSYNTSISGLTSNTGHSFRGYVTYTDGVDTFTDYDTVVTFTTLGAGGSMDPYVIATIEAPDAELTDFTHVVDTDRFPTAWFDEIDTVDWTKLRVAKDSDESEIPFNVLDSASARPLIVFKWPGARSTAVDVRIYAPKAARASVAPGDALGGNNAWDTSTYLVKPLRSSFADITATGADGTVDGTPVFTATGALGPACDFDGVDDRELIPHEAGMDFTNLSVFVWSTGVGTNNSAGVVVKRDGTGQAWKVERQATNATNYRAQGNGQATALAFANYTSPLHSVCVEFEPAVGRRAFINNSLVASDLTSFTLDTSTDDLSIGFSNVTGSSYWDGTLSWLRLDSTIRSDAWKKAWYREFANQADVYGTWTFEAGAAAPTVTTPTSASIGSTTATLGGNITSDGGDTITERGIVYALTATNADPEIGGTGVTKVVASGTATGVFTVGVTGLTAESGYSFKAYATNGEGTGYSGADTFTTTETPSVVGRARDRSRIR